MWARLTNSCGPRSRAADLEDEGLDRLADPVVLERRLLGRGEDRLRPGDPALAGQVEDDRSRLDPVDRPGDELAFAAGELVVGDVTLGLAEALQDDLLGGLGMDPAEGLGIELLGLTRSPSSAFGSCVRASSRLSSVNGSSTSATAVRARKTRIWPVSPSIRTWMSSSPSVRR